MALDHQHAGQPASHGTQGPVLESQAGEKLPPAYAQGPNVDIDSEKGWRNRFGGSDVKIGGRIAPVLPHLAAYDVASDESGSDILGKQLELEADNAIKYRTCSWPKVSRAPSLPQPFFKLLACRSAKCAPRKNEC